MKGLAPIRKNLPWGDSCMTLVGRSSIFLKINMKLTSMSQNVGALRKLRSELRGETDKPSLK